MNGGVMKKRKFGVLENQPVRIHTSMKSRFKF
jgi:hypothetical protein